MKKWFSILSVAAIFATAPVAFAQGQGQAIGQADGRIQVPKGTQLKQKHVTLNNFSKHNPPPVNDSVPMFSYSIFSPIDQNTYSGKMVGQDPTAPASGTTTIPTVIIPVRLDFQLGRNNNIFFDPTAADADCIGAGNTALSLTQSSPIFQNSDYLYGSTPVGSQTQYTDAYQRANFWNSGVSGNSAYHTLLGVTTLPIQTVTVSSSRLFSSGAVFSGFGVCGTNAGNTNPSDSLGVVDFSFWDPKAQSILTNLKLQPGTFAIFLFYNAVLSEGAPILFPSNCCILGYHNVVASTGQTYAVAEFEGRENTLFGGVGDITALSHEVAEWMDDPLTNNPTPAWGPIGQVSSCQSNLENGDPLSGTQFPAINMNGFNYHPQEIVFQSWFFRKNPSAAPNNWFSNNGTFQSDAGGVCH